MQYKYTHCTNTQYNTPIKSHIQVVSKQALCKGRVAYLGLVLQEHVVSLTEGTTMLNSTPFQRVICVSFK